MGGYSNGSGSSNSDRNPFYKSMADTKPEPKKKEPNKFVEFVKGGGTLGLVYRTVKEAARKEKANALDFEGQGAGITKQRSPRYATTNQNSNNDSSDSAKSIEQPKVPSQMDNSEVKSDLIIANKIAPTDVEMTNDERLIARKRGRRTKTILTSSTGVNTSPTLSKKTLLG